MSKTCPTCSQTMWLDPNSPRSYCPNCEVTDASDRPADQGQVGGTHYKDMAVQPWHVMESILTPEEFRGFLKGNIIKYAMRQGRKGEDDADKCIHYQRKLKEVLAQITPLYLD